MYSLSEKLLLSFFVGGLLGIFIGAQIGGILLGLGGSENTFITITATSSLVGTITVPLLVWTDRI